MIHEDAVLEVHPEATEFLPVRGGLVRAVIGWMFQVPDGGASSHAVKHGWVTHDGEVSRVLSRRAFDAERNLRAYLRSRPMSTVEVAEDGA